MYYIPRPEPFQARGPDFSLSSQGSGNSLPNPHALGRSLLPPAWREDHPARASPAVLPRAAPTHSSCHTAELHLPAELERDLWAWSSAAGGGRLRFPMSWTQWGGAVTRLQEHMLAAPFPAEAHGLFKTPPRPHLLQAFPRGEVQPADDGPDVIWCHYFPCKMRTKHNQKPASRGKLPQLLTTCLPSGTRAEGKGAMLGLLHGVWPLQGKPT